VLQSFYFLAFHGQWGSKFTPIEKLAGIIAAVGHDIDHPGLSNQFLVKARDPSAIMYSDASVNEYHHSAHMFSITLASQYNIFANLTSEEYDEMRRIIIKLILATDMGKHFEMLSKFKTKIQSSGFRNLDTQENRLMVLEIALKCGDLNNPSRCQEIAVQWAHCIMEEFYRQGDKEKELGFPISNFMDRHNSNVAKCQVGFIDLLVAPL
ncbi:cAMP-specific 3',5'-cyclic phosphodiesterase 4D, partial [Rhizoclosmatium hyalinum]